MADKTISAVEFDARFDAGEDMADYINWSSPVRTASGTTHIDLEIRMDVIRRFDAEAARVGKTRDALMVEWLTSRLDQAA